MPAVYAKCLMPSLAQRLEEQLECKSREEQLQLFEELALARTFLIENLELMTAARMASQHEDPEVRKKVPPHALAEMDMLVRQGINHVAELASKAARIQKDLADVVSVASLGFFVSQMTRVIHKRLTEAGVPDEVVATLASDIREQVRLPAPGVNPQVNVDRVVEVSFDD